MYVRARVCESERARVCFFFACARVIECVRAHALVCMCVYVRMFVYVRMCVYVCACACVYSYFSKLKRLVRLG